MEIIKKMKKNCFCCMEEHEVPTVLVKEKTIFKGVEVTYNAIYEYCERCDEYNATEEMITANDIAIKNAYRNKMGLLTSDKIIAIRKKYVISQSDLCTLLAWGKKTITRYEGHQVQDAAHDKILRKLDSDPEWFLSLLKKAKNEFSEAAYKKYYKNALKLFEESKDLYLQKAVGAHYACSEESEVYKCIYSLKDESNTTFNTSEHIFPKFLGGIHTLDKGLVCDEVNQMFSLFERSFARNNPLVAISRMFYGPLGRPKHDKKDIVTFCHVQDGTTKLGYIVKGIPKIINQLHISLSCFLNQKGTLKTSKVQFKMFLEPGEMVDDIKLQYDAKIENFRTDIIEKCKQQKFLQTSNISKDCIIIGAWKGTLFIGAHESVSKATLNDCVKKLRIMLTKPNIFKEGKQSQPCCSSSQTEFDIKMEFSINDALRIYGKIAFNCLTKIYGGKYVLQSCFDEFRKSIYLGQAVEKFVTLGNNNNESDYLPKIYNLGKNYHIFLCLQVENNMVGILYLYGRSIPVIIKFTENGILHDPPIPNGYICDWENHKEMTLHEAMREKVQLEHQRFIDSICKSTL